MQSAVEESGYGPRLQGTTGVRAGVQFYSGSGRHQRKRACDLGDPCGSADIPHICHFFYTVKFFGE